MRIFVTGTAGFIGFHLARRLIADGHMVVGYDGMTPYYDVALKKARLEILQKTNGYRHHTGMLEDAEALQRAAADCDPEIIIHLAAQAGVRYSLEHPEAYVSANLDGTFNVLELAKAVQPKHFLAASTSSVYGGNQTVPFRESDRADYPLTLYAATKKANEAMTHAYAHLWQIPTTCFRFFTVYGPWGRPDMAPIKFLRLIEAGQPIEIYNNGQMRRDFTFIDDLVEAIVRLIPVVPVTGEPLGSDAVVDTLSPVAPWRVVNIGNGEPVELMDFIAALEQALGKVAEKRFLPRQPGDPVETFANCDLLEQLTGVRPSTPVQAGIKALVDWSRAR